MYVEKPLECPRNSENEVEVEVKKNWRRRMDLNRGPPVATTDALDHSTAVVPLYKAVFAETVQMSQDCSTITSKFSVVYEQN